jgi:hypothetical protein
MKENLQKQFENVSVQKFILYEDILSGHTETQPETEQNYQS